MATHFSPEQNEIWIKNESQIQDDVRQDRSALIEDALRFSIARTREIPNIGDTVHSRPNLRCLAAGAHGVAVMGEVMRADDPEATVRRLLAALAVK